MAATETDIQAGNGNGNESQSVGARLEEVRDDAQTLVHHAEQAAHDVGDLVREQVRERPYLMLGLAAGAGFVLGGGMSVRTTRALVNLGGRALINRIVEEVFKPV